MCWILQGVEGVWHSLTGLLIETIKLSVVATDVLEALWLCRIRQSPIHQVCVCVCVCACLRVRMCMCVCVCVCIEKQLSFVLQRQGVVDGAAVFLATWFEQGQGEKG